MTILEVLKSIGIEVPLFIGGSAGAVTFLTKPNKMTYFQQFLKVLGGGLSANYLTPLVLKLLFLSQEFQYGVCFLVGYSGLKFVEVIINYFYNKLKK